MRLEGHATVPPDMFDLYVYVNDVDALHEELVGRRAEVHGAPARQGYGMYDFRVSDPAGYVLAFGRVANGTSEPTR